MSHSCNILNDSNVQKQKENVFKFFFVNFLKVQFSLHTNFKNYFYFQQKKNSI